MITSAGPEEGKSTVIANLAVTMAQTSKQTLLVDADLRRPMLHKLLKTRQHPGLTNILVDGIEPDEAIVATGVQNLSLLPSGPIPPNPAELLDSEAMRDLWPQLRDRYDQVLVDTPPTIALTDAAVLASQVDGIILVIQAGETRIDVARETKELLTHAGGKILGAVLNGVKYGGDSYYRYYYYYGHGQREDARQKTS
jgi:capsular exopolysaccharide synthesis family protein